MLILKDGVLLREFGFSSSQLISYLNVNLPYSASAQLIYTRRCETPTGKGVAFSSTKGHPLVSSPAIELFSGFFTADTLPHRCVDTLADGVVDILDNQGASLT